jgi:AcrR family transcriptional regulator
VLGLRARKKQRTREALLRVALELFTTQGYDRTTVDEIADAVEVSQRTFFRYFAGKEDVAFGVTSLFESQFVDALRRRPPEEGPIEAMRRAVTAAWEDLGATAGAALPVDLVVRTYRMIESTPALLAAHLRRNGELEDEIARLVARREGLDPDTDPRPRVAVAAVVGVMRMAGRVWGQQAQETSVAALSSITQSYLDHLAPSLVEQWHSTVGAPRAASRGKRVCSRGVAAH